jgi:hypothetical protein
MVVEVETDPTFIPGIPKELFKGTYFSVTGLTACTLWDIHPDDKRFLMMKPPQLTNEASGTDTPQDKINIVLNWFEELKERVPVD